MRGVRPQLAPGRSGEWPADVGEPGRGSSGLLQLLALAPLGCAAAYLLFVVIRFPRILEGIHLNPDASWAPVLARDLATGPGGGHALVGAASHFTTIWFLWLTRWVPFRDALWDVAPFLMYLAGLGLLAWACRRIAGTIPALLTLAVGACATAPVLLTVMSEGLHGATYFADGALAAFLVFWVTRSAGQVWQERSAVVATILLVGATAASDPLFLPSGLGPFLGAPIALWLVRRDRRSAQMALLTTGITAASGLFAVAVNGLMVSLGFQRTYETSGFKLASPSVALENLRSFGRALRTLGNGSFSSQSFGSSEAMHLVMALLLVGAVVVPFLLLLGSLRKRRRWSSASDEARFLYLTYWILSGLAVCAAFSLTAFAEGPSDPSRYVAPAFFAVAATAPVWASRLGWRRVTVALGAVLFCLLSITERQGLFGYEIIGQSAPARPAAIAFLESQGVTHGYTGYFDSHPLTLQSDLRVHFYPVIACRTPVSPRLCPFFVNTRTKWYAPRPGIRTFVLFDASNPAAIASPPTPDLGPPAVTRQFGLLRVYVYDYDVASKLARPCPSGSVNQFFCPNSPA